MFELVGNSQAFPVVNVASRLCFERGYAIWKTSHCKQLKGQRKQKEVCSRQPWVWKEYLSWWYLRSSKGRWQWYLEKSIQRAAAEANWEELLGMLLKLNHCQAPELMCKGGNVCVCSQGYWINQLGWLQRPEAPKNYSKEKNIKNRIDVRKYRREMTLTITRNLVKSWT